MPCGAHSIGCFELRSRYGKQWDVTCSSAQILGTSSHTSTRPASWGLRRYVCVTPVFVSIVAVFSHIATSRFPFDSHNKPALSRRAKGRSGSAPTKSSKVHPRAAAVFAHPPSTNSPISLISWCQRFSGTSAGERSGFRRAQLSAHSRLVATCCWSIAAQPSSLLLPAGAAAARRKSASADISSGAVAREDLNLGSDLSTCPEVLRSGQVDRFIRGFG
jgi:hypothetical protein